jgi:hypothetical protein
MPTWKVSLASGVLVNRPDSIEHLVGIQISVGLPIAVSLKSSNVGEQRKADPSAAALTSCQALLTRLWARQDAHPIPFFPLSFGPYRPLDILCLPNRDVLYALEREPGPVLPFEAGDFMHDLPF